jgi:Zn-dependent protease with chaperone function
MVVVALAVMAGLGLAELSVWPAAAAAIALMIWVLLGLPAAMRAQELRADRRAVELLGERAGSLELMLERIADEDGGRWSWFRRLLDDHPHPAERLARVRTQLAA